MLPGVTCRKAVQEPKPQSKPKLGFRPMLPKQPDDTDYEDIGGTVNPIQPISMPEEHKLEPNSKPSPTQDTTLPPCDEHASELQIPGTTCRQDSKKESQ